MLAARITTPNERESLASCILVRLAGMKAPGVAAGPLPLKNEASPGADGRDLTRILISPSPLN